MLAVENAPVQGLHELGPRFIFRSPGARRVRIRGHALRRGGFYPACVSLFSARNEQKVVIPSGLTVLLLQIHTVPIRYRPMG